MNAHKLFCWFSCNGKIFLFEKTQNHFIPEILQLMARVCVFHMITELSLQWWWKYRTLWPVWLASHVWIIQTFQKGVGRTQIFKDEKFLGQIKVLFIQDNSLLGHALLISTMNVQFIDHNVDSLKSQSCHKRGIRITGMLGLKTLWFVNLRN